MPTQRLPLDGVDETHPQARVCAACEVLRSALFGVLGAASPARIHADIAAPAHAPDERVYGRGKVTKAVFTIRAEDVYFERLTQGGARRIVRLQVALRKADA